MGLVLFLEVWTHLRSVNRNLLKGLMISGCEFWSKWAKRDYIPDTRKGRDTLICRILAEATPNPTVYSKSGEAPKAVEA